MEKNERKLTTRDLARIPIAAVLIAVCAWISVPGPVPFTLQTLGVFLSVGLLGGKNGSLAVALYLLLGAAGVPVFAGFAGGIGVLAGATGGYLVGFLACAVTMWLVMTLLKQHTWALIPAMLTGLLVCYALGTAWYIAVYARAGSAAALSAVLLRCVLPFVIPDLAKAAVALLLVRRLRALRLFP